MSTFYDEQQKIKDTADPLDLKTEGNSSEKSNQIQLKWIFYQTDFNEIVVCLLLEATVFLFMRVL